MAAKSYKRIAAVTRSFKILEYLSNQKAPISGADASKELGISYDTLMCYLATLEDAGLVRSVGEHFTLGLALAKFWSKIKSREESRIRESQRILDALETGEF